MTARGAGGVLDGFGRLPPVALAWFVVSGLGGASLARLLWFRGIDRVGGSVGSVVCYSRPLFAVALAALSLGERVTLATEGGRRNSFIC